MTLQPAAVVDDVEHVNPERRTFGHGAKARSPTSWPEPYYEAARTYYRSARPPAGSSGAHSVEPTHASRWLTPPSDTRTGRFEGSVTERSRQPQLWQLSAYEPLPAHPTREDLRKAALRALANPPTTKLDVWGRVFRSMARVHATFDMEMATALQEQAQRMSPTREGARTLARMRAQLRGEAPTPVSEADQISRRREVQRMMRGGRRRARARSVTDAHRNS